MCLNPCPGNRERYSLSENGFFITLLVLFKVMSPGGELHDHR